MALAWRETWADYWLSIKNIVFPQFCAVCEARLLTEEVPHFCPTCWETSPSIEAPFCSISGHPHEGAIGFDMPGEFPSAAWRGTTEAQRGFHRMYGASVYEGAVAKAIKLLKFRGKTRVVAPLAGRMRAFAESYMDTAGYGLIVPVPLYRVRLRERGFNQAALLAAAAAPAFPNAAAIDALVRTRPTAAQSRTTTPAERRKNIRGAFAVRPGIEGEIAGQTVLLVDDVITTAATIIECAHVLRAAGATRVDGFACALTVRR